MDKTFIINNQTFPYQIKKSKRVKRARISMSHNLQVTVTIPWWSSFKSGERLLANQYDWLIKTWEKFQTKKLKNLPKVEDWKVYKAQALELVQATIQKYAYLYPYEYKKITIKNLSTRWGSCSKKKNLNFHYRIVFLQREEAEYLVVHELCHLKQMNHSKQFWSLVAKAFPEYKKLRKAMHEYDLRL